MLPLPPNILGVKTLHFDLGSIIIIIIVIIISFDKGCGVMLDLMGATTRE